MSGWIECNSKRSLVYTSQQAEDKREKIQALSLANGCYSMKLDLLTNATVVDDAIRFVTEKSECKEQVKSSSSSSDNSSSNEDDKESKEPETGQIMATVKYGLLN